MMEKIRVMILDDHQSIVDGYFYRLNSAPDIAVVATALFGEDLEPLLSEHSADVLILDVYVPTSKSNPNPYPILFNIPKLLQLYPGLSVLAVTMHSQPALINAVLEAGASGYVLKDDHSSILDLANIVRTVANGGIHISQTAYQQIKNSRGNDLTQPLSIRQKEALSLCAAYPNASTSELAQRMNIAHSTLRNLLSSTYMKLDVRTRMAAVAKAYQIGLLTADPLLPEF